MDKNVSFSQIWSEAGKGGIILAAVSSAYLAFTFFTGKEPSAWLTLATLLLNLAKTVGCILLMRWLMIRFHRNTGGCSRTDVRRFGSMTALLSALIFATVSMALYLWMPDVASGAIDEALESLGNRLTSDQEEALEGILDHMPAISFWSTLIYCSLYGWILSSILAAVTVPSNPFSEMGNEGGSGDEGRDDEE